MNIPKIKFVQGLVTPRIEPRKLSAGCKVLDNFIPGLQGYVERRPGTKIIYKSTRPLVDDDE